MSGSYRRQKSGSTVRFVRRLRSLRLFLYLAVLATSIATATAASGDKPAARETIAMIGAGNMGQALGTLWAAAGYHVVFATRHPDELDAVVENAGHGAEAAAVVDAVQDAGIVVLAVPYGAEPNIAKRYGDAMRSKILVDVDNAFARRDGAIAKKAEKIGEAVYSARLFEGTRFIRAFNMKGASSFPSPSGVASADFEIRWTTNDESARPVAEALIKATGATPVYKGGLQNAPEY